MLEFSDYIPINLISLGILGALGLRRLVRIEGHHELRVVILTGLLWVPVFYLFILAFLSPTGIQYCVLPDEPNGYTISGM